MRFVDVGPDIPESLIRDHLAGNVIFVVGAGLSMPAGLPSFQDLVIRVYENLGLGFPNDSSSGASDAEIDACKDGAWDRVLTLLERRLG
ncbi:hypothetical protein AMST5_03022 [freshwater sediment metagenome]|uniref:Deacetylase sirtuin-type domain-containing protein n=1 Tax=freshwater sediment metagenome TaxID=556182 RepID=A0AA48M4J1_9ZZZZ